jgi:hypothetical protein
MNVKLTPEKMTAFCAALAETCQVAKAAAAVGISRYTAYIWRKNDPEFAARWDDAMRAGLLVLEDEMHRRAIDGVAEPVLHQGQVTYLTEYYTGEDGKPAARVKVDEQGQPIPMTVRKYSDTLAIFLAKAHDPKYRDNSKLELSGHLALGNISDDDLEAEIASLAGQIGHSALSAGQLDPTYVDEPATPPAGHTQADDCDDLV